MSDNDQLLMARERLRAQVERRCLARISGLKRRPVFSHVTALQLMGVDLPHHGLDESALHICVPSRDDRPHLNGIARHVWSQDQDVMETDGGVLHTGPVATWAAMATHLNLIELVVLGDALVRRQCPLTTVDAFQRFLDDSTKFRGKMRCLRAAELIRAGTDSPQESRGRLLFDSAGLPECCVNYEAWRIDDAGQDEFGTNGELLPVQGHLNFFDMAWPEQRVAVEYDGFAFHGDQRAWMKDRTKRRHFEKKESWDIIPMFAADLETRSARRDYVSLVAQALGCDLACPPRCPVPDLWDIG